MKNKLAILAAASIAAAPAMAEIAITENLAIEGFADMSWTNSTEDFSAAGVPSADSDSFGIDQVEVDFLFDFDTVTGEIHLHSGAGALNTGGVGNGLNGDEIGVEQAFATYHFSDEVSLTTGRYLSFLGFESDEPTGLYQFSGAYDLGGRIAPAYNNGAKLVYGNENGFFGVSLQDSLYTRDNRLGGNSASDYGVEVAAAYTGEEGLTLFAGLGVESGSVAPGGADYTTWVLDLYAAYETGALTLAAEFFYGDDEGGVAAASAGDTEFYAWLLMANWAFDESWAATVRISGENYDPAAAGVADSESLKLTLSPSYAWSDNLLTVFEVSYADYERTGADSEAYSFAVEQVFSF